MIVAATFALNGHSIQLQEKRTLLIEREWLFSEHRSFGEVSTVQPAIAAVLILASDRLKAGLRTL